MAVWSTVNYSQSRVDGRIDAEYYQPYLLKAETALEKTGWPIVNLGSLVKNGYRVVYENTKILDEEFDPNQHVRFLQAADLSGNFPAINLDNLGWVNREDWERYPQGHIKHGELLIEVKGKAEKVVLVPADCPEDILVTGTLYKLTLNEGEIDRHYVLIYLLSQLGKDFRDRGKTNTLISYVNKDDLYKIPIPIAPSNIQAQISEHYQTALKLYQTSKSLYAEAEALLIRELGLDAIDFSVQTFYTGSFSETAIGTRLDAEYFQPKYREIVQHLNANFETKNLNQIGKVLRGKNFPYKEHGIPVIRSGDLDNLDELEDLKYVDPNQRLFYLNKGDVCISSIGFGSIGKVQVFDKNEQYSTVGEVTVIRPKLVNPYYLQLYLKSPAGQFQIERFITGATGQLHLYPRDVKKITIPIISIDKQKEFERLIMQCRQIRQEAQSLLDEAKRKVELMILGED